MNISFIFSQSSVQKIIKNQYSSKIKYQSVIATIKIMTTEKLLS